MLNTCGLTLDKSEIYCWGDGWEVIGNASERSKSVLIATAPIKKPEGVNSWLKITATGRYHACALGDNQQVYCWGAGMSNIASKLGRGAAIGVGKLGTSVPVPTLIEPAYEGVKWKDIAIGNDATCAIDMNNKIYCWGSNEFGLLGKNFAGEKLSASPVQVDISDTLIKEIKSIHLGSENRCVIDGEDHAYCWGKIPEFPVDKTHATTGNPILQIPSPILGGVN